MTRASRLSALILGAFLALGPLSGRPTSACPNCKEAVAAQDPEEAKRLSSGYYYSILLMIGMPVALFGTGALMVVRAVRRGGIPEM